MADSGVERRDYGYAFNVTTSASANLTRLTQLLCDYATNGSGEDSEYRELRRFFVHASEYRSSLPRWLKTYRSLDAFWYYISRKFPTYAERKNFIEASFTDLKRALTQALPASAEAEGVRLTRNESVWDKALHEVTYNPEGALTLALITLENSCRNVLERSGQPFDDSLDLYGLYQETLKALAITDTRKDNFIFGVMLGSLADLVSGLELFNSEMTDGEALNLSPDQAELLVNLAATTDTFLQSSYQAAARDAALN